MKSKRSQGETPARSILWITDPWGTLDHAQDTTLRLLHACVQQGIRTAWADVSTLRLESGEVWIDGQESSEIVSALRTLSMGNGSIQKEVRLPKAKAFQIHDFDSIQYRTDPPLDLHYFHPLQLLALAHSQKPSLELVNPLPVLFARNEKLEPAMLPPQFAPKTLVSAEPARLLRFLKAARSVVLKPLHEAQSKGIEKLLWDSHTTEREIKQISDKLKAITQSGNQPVLLQKYLKKIESGEIRLWFLDGELLAFARKLPLEGDFRVNLDRGSQVVTTILDRPTQAAAKALSKRLKELQIRLAAIDVIGGKVTDFNFTSPGLIVTMEKVLGRDLATPIVTALARPSPF